MSVLGSGVASGLAQTFLQAQQVSRQREKETHQPLQEARRVREMAEARLRGEEADKLETAAQPGIDDQLPEYFLAYQEVEPGDGDQESEAAALRLDAPGPQSGLYRHLDLHA